MIWICIKFKRSTRFLFTSRKTLGRYTFNILHDKGACLFQLLAITLSEAYLHTLFLTNFSIVSNWVKSSYETKSFVILLNMFFSSFFFLLTQFFQKKYLVNDREYYCNDYIDIMINKFNTLLNIIYKIWYVHVQSDRESFNQ